LERFCAKRREKLEAASNEVQRFIFAWSDTGIVLEAQRKKRLIC
jgi:hypothetical protein